MTRDDASDLLSEIVRRAVAAPADRVKREVRKMTGSRCAFPIDGYDELTAAQIVVAARRPRRSPTLRWVRDYERRNANRKTVLAAVEPEAGLRPRTRSRASVRPR